MKRREFLQTATLASVVVVAKPTSAFNQHTSIQPGAKVQLRSGGPVMTVDQIVTPGNRREANCYYFQGEERLSQTFNVLGLELIEASSTTGVNPGDVAVLPSGSPRFVVNHITTPGNQRLAEVCWYGNSTRRSLTFNSYALKMLTRGERDRVEPGDIVKLPIDGSPTMTVNRIVTPGDQRIAELTWFPATRPESDSLNSLALKILERAKGDRIEAGNKVKLHSGSPMMTVVRITTPGKERHAEVQWFEDANPLSHSFNTLALIKV